MTEKKLKKRLLYLIGPGFMVMGHSKNTLDYLVKGYNVIVASGKTSINCRGFEHQTLNAFSRNPNLLKDLFLFIEVFRVIKGTKPDIVIFSTPKIAFFSMLACVYRKVPCLYIHRGAVYQNYIGMKKEIFKIIDLLTLKGADKTFFISRSLHSYVSEELRLSNVEYGRKFNSAQGLDPKYQEENLINPLACRERKSTIRVGFLGRFCEDKGFKDVLDIVSLFNDNKGIRFRFKGMPDPGYEFSIDALKSSGVLLEHWDDNVIDYLTSIDVLLFPSRREGFGNVCIQAAACGVPSIGIDGPGVKDAIIDGVTGFLVKEKKDYVPEASKIILELQRNREFFCPKTCREFALRNFDRDQILEELGSSLVGILSKK